MTLDPAILSPFPGHDRVAAGGRTVVARYSPGSQSRLVLEQKEELARRLLASGLTVTQVSAQLRCSKPFVRRVRDEGEDSHFRP